MPKKPDHTKYSTGHRPHMTGGGVHDSRPNRERTRGDAQRAAIEDQGPSARKRSMPESDNLVLIEQYRQGDGKFGNQPRTGPAGTPVDGGVPNLDDDAYEDLVVHYHRARAEFDAKAREVVLMDARLLSCSVLDSWPDATHVTFRRNSNPFAAQWDPASVTLADGAVVERDEERYSGEAAWSEFSDTRMGMTTPAYAGFARNDGDDITWDLRALVEAYDREIVGDDPIGA